MRGEAPEAKGGGGRAAEGHLREPEVGAVAEVEGGRGRGGKIGRGRAGGSGGHDLLEGDGGELG